MTLEQRSMWLFERFSLQSAPEWPCPVCGAATLKLDNRTLHSEELSKQQSGPDEGDLIEGRFCCLLSCIKCEAAIGLVGEQFTEWAYFQTGNPNEAPVEGGWVHWFVPLAFTDAPPMIHVPRWTCDAVKRHLRRAFALFWMDREACSNAMRSAIEHLLSDQGIPTHDTSRRLRLAERIKAFTNNEPDCAKTLEAIKWPADNGSHGRSLTREDLIDMFEQTERALEDIYERKRKRLDSVRDEVNQLKGPRSSGPPSF